MLQGLHSYLSGDGLGPTLVRALVGSAGVRIVGMAFGFLVGVQLARGLGAEGYGTYGLAMAIISLLTIPTEFGLPQLVTREVASGQVRQDWPLIRAVLRWANRTVMMLSLGMAALGLITWLVLKDHVSAGVMLTLLAGLPLVPLVALGNLRGAALRGLQQIVRGQIPEIVVRPALFSLFLLIASILLPSGLSPAAAMAMQGLAAAFTLFLVAYMLRAILPVTSSIGSTATQESAWLRSAWPMALTEGMRMLHGNMSVLLLGVLSTTVWVGVFRVATSMGLLLNMPVSLLHIVASPLVSKLYATGDSIRLQRLLSWIAVASVVGVTVVTFPFLIFGAEILGLVFGSEFSGANASLLILSAGTLVGSGFGAGVILLNMTGHERRVTRAFAWSLLALGALSPLFIWLWGAVGAAIANSIVYIFWSLLMWHDARRLLRIDTSIFALFRGFDASSRTGAN